MKQVRIVEPGQVAVEDAPAPDPQPGEALVRVLYVGICGSDVHTYTGVNPLCRYPLVPGHELSARVEAVNDPGSELVPGDTVVLEPLVRCGECYPCRLGRYNCCEHLHVLGVHSDGGMRELFAAPTQLFHRTPADLSPKVAALAEPCTIGCQALARGRVTADDTVVVIGAGPIGLFAALVAKDLGARVGVWEIKQTRLDLALRLGVDFGVNPDDGDPIGHTLDALGARPSVVVEAVGKPETVRHTIELVSPAGRAVIVGLSAEDARFPEVHLIRKEVDVLGSRNSRCMFPKAIEFVRSHQDLLGRVITHELPLCDAERGIQIMRDKADGAMKAVLKV